MSTLPTFEYGQAASAAQLMGALQSLRGQGQSVLDALVAYRTSSLVDFEQKLEALNSRRQRANRVSVPYTAVNFLVSDLFDIDQTISSATVRADVQAATLKERTSRTNAVIQSQSFSTTNGTARSISSSQMIYSVQATSGAVPTGTIALELFEALEMSVVTFDLAAMPPTPYCLVSASADGTTYTDAVETSLNGYRLTAWFPLMSMKFIKLAITPAAPDSLGGDTYTFGLTDFAGSETEFQLVSEIVTVPKTFAPSGSSLLFVAGGSEGMVYFLSFNGSAWKEYSDGDIVSIPGTASFSASHVTVTHTGSQYLVGGALPANVYPGSVKVTDESANAEVRTAPGATGVTAAAAILSHDYISVHPGSTLSYLPCPATQAPASKQFSTSYVTGPASVTVQLKVQLSTAYRTQTPTFKGASLQEI